MTDISERIESTSRALADAARAADMLLTGDQRISEADTAILLGYSVGHLRNLRTEGKGPAAFRLGLNGCRVSYRLLDIASWIEANRDFT